MSSKRSVPKRFSAGVALGALVAASFTTTASATEEFSFDRIGGGDRYATAALVAAAHDGGDSAILVNGSADNYVDALTANYLAGELEAPVLLTKREATPSAILKQLAAESITDVVVVGGDVAISGQQVDGLEERGYDVRRVAGINRFETNAAVIEAAGAADDGIGLVATGHDFADSLAGGPLVYRGHPLALSRVDRMDAVVLDALRGAGVDQVYVLGGPIAVSGDVVAQLESAGISVIKRLSGAERASTSVAIADELISEHGFSAGRVNVASGNNSLYGADALSGGPLTGQQNSPLLITNSAGNASRSLDTFLEEGCSTLATGVLFGGMQATSEITRARLEAAAQSCNPDDVTDPFLTVAIAWVEAETVAASVTAVDDVELASVEAELLNVHGAVVATGDAEGYEGDYYDVTFPGVEDGTYTVRFTATDTSGNTAQASTSAVEVAGDDVTAPILAGLTAAVDGDTVSASVTVADDTGVAEVRAELLDGQGVTVEEKEAPAAKGAYEVTFERVAPGSYAVRITATDAAGNRAHLTSSPFDVVDVTAPVLTGPSVSVHEKNFIAAVTARDDFGVSLVMADLVDPQGNQLDYLHAEDLDGDDVYEVPFPIANDGVYAVRFEAFDASGNAAEITTDYVEVDVDLDPPVLADAAASADSSAVSASVTVTDEMGLQSVTADLLNKKGYSIDSANLDGVDDKFEVTFDELRDGAYTVRFTAVDLQGNRASLTTNFVTVDTLEGLEVGSPYVGDDGLTVTLNSMVVTESTGSYRYAINYTLLNETDVAIDEGSWKAYDFDAGNSLPQYGFFGRLFPGETLMRNYVFEEVKSVEFEVVAYHSDQFLNDYPPSDALVWRVPEAQ